MVISGAQVFSVELSLLRVSARHPRPLCETELARGFAAASSTWRQCTAATSNMTAYCGHQKSTSGDILVSPRRGAFHLVGELPAWMRGRKKQYSFKISMYNPYFLENHITKTENYGRNSIGEKTSQTIITIFCLPIQISSYPFPNLL